MAASVATRAPAFQFYAADYLADENVQLMSLEEEGCYVRLMAFCWREGSIPADFDKLSRLAKGASTTVLRVVADCFTPNSTDPSRLVHMRLEAEREKQREWREKSAEGGRKSAEKRAEIRAAIDVGTSNGHPEDDPRVVEPPYQPNGNTSSLSLSLSSSSKEQVQKQTPSAKKQKAKVSRSKEEPFVLPPWVDPKIWAGYMGVRKTKRAGSSPTVLNNVIQCLAEFRSRGHDANEILATSMRAGYPNVYEPKSIGASHGAFKSKGDATLDASRGAIAAVEAFSYYPDAHQAQYPPASADGHSRLPRLCAGS